MQRNNQYTFDSRIRYSEIDHHWQLTLPGIIDYFQDCSTFQSEEVGLGVRYLREHGRAWVLSSWQVVVDRYPDFTEEVQVSTWATGFKGMLGDRNFCMTDKKGKNIAYANSLWVYMDMEKKRPVKPQPCEIEPYGTREALAMEYAPRKIALPAELTEFPQFSVKKCHIDTNEHVNNCQYIQMAQEVAGEMYRIKDKEKGIAVEERLVCQMRAEYKKSAVYRDVIVPKAAVEEERMVVELCDTEGKPYAIVEFKYF